MVKNLFFAFWQMSWVVWLKNKFGSFPAVFVIRPYCGSRNDASWLADDENCYFQTWTRPSFQKRKVRVQELIDIKYFWKIRKSMSHNPFVGLLSRFRRTRTPKVRTALSRLCSAGQTDNGQRFFENSGQKRDKDRTRTVLSVDVRF